MNRIEIMGLFTALDVLVKEKNLAGIETIVTTVLNEAKTDKSKKDEPPKE